MPRPIKCSIDLSALRHNIACARNLAQGAQIYGVVKANAYGHGLLQTLPAWHAVDGLALVELDQAILLREQGYSRPILLLEGIFSPEELPLVAEYSLDIVLHHPCQLDWLLAWDRVEQSKELTNRSNPLSRFSIFIKVNTGMHRLGFPVTEIPEILHKIQTLTPLPEIILMTHFACADIPGGIAAQLERLQPIMSIWPGRWSLQNSAAFLCAENRKRLSMAPSIHDDSQIVRLGIMLYGASPFENEDAQNYGLLPVMRLESQLIGVQEVPPGESVGYGATYTVPMERHGPQRVGMVACGYADGYPRHAPTGTPVAVGRHITRLLGRVSMDMLAVDLSTIPEASVGTPVELWGGIVPIDVVARAAGTISYELMCAIHPRVAITRVDAENSVVISKDEPILQK